MRSTTVLEGMRKCFDRNVVALSPDGCWMWKGKAKVNGYHRCGFSVKGKAYMMYAHRLAYELIVGKIPEGALCCHSCDNRGCVNPAHIFLGSHQDNSDDKWRKGRQGPPQIKRGYKHPSARLAEDMIPMIRADNRPISVIASAYGCSPENIYHIKKRQTWRHVA